MSVRRTVLVAMIAAVVTLPASVHAAAFRGPGPLPEPPVISPPISRAPNQAQLRQQTTQQQTVGLVSPSYVPPGVNAQGVYVTPITPASKGATSAYALDWTIGTAGKSGCLVCHGDPNLRRIVAGVSVSMYVDTLALQGSAHANLLCTDCHQDFAYKVPHANGQASDTWRTVAKTSCKNCHQPEYIDWAKSSHSAVGTSTASSGAGSASLGAPGSSAPGKPRPFCGDCHEGHTIPAKNDAVGAAVVRASGLSRCGSCHPAWAADYNDYYHGAAYRRGASDAPACWQCHNTHLVLPSSDKLSSTYSENLVATCSQCHRTAGSGYVQYGQLVHQHQAVLQKNPIFSAVDTATTAIENMFRSVMSVFRKSGS